jgi:hypothetical protein
LEGSGCGNRSFAEIADRAQHFAAIQISNVALKFMWRSARPAA